MHGYSIDEFKTLDISELHFNKGGIFEEHSELSQQNLSNDTNQIEIEHRHKDGHKLFLSVTLSKIIPEKEVYLLLSQDKTERKIRLTSL